VLLSSSGFCESHALLYSATEILLVFPVFRQILIKFGTDVHFEFRSSRRNESHAFLKGVKDFCHFFHLFFLGGGGGESPYERSTQYAGKYY
jgi:hypothetical protein